MNYLKGIKLDYINNKRDNYMSLSDICTDLSTDCLINLLSKLDKLNRQLDVMRELEFRMEHRNEITEDKYFELLETCNGK